MGFLSRWIFAFILIAATFNPSQWNFVNWAGAHYSSELPLTVLFGLILAIWYIIYLRATLHSIGGLGMFLVFLVFGVLVWVLWDRGLLSLGNSDLNVWMGILALSLVLGVGLSWNIVRRALTGALDVDKADP